MPGGPRGGMGGGPGRGPGRGQGGGFGDPYHGRPGGPPPPPPPYGHRGYHHRPHGCCLMPFCVFGGIIALVAMLIGFCF